MRIGYPCINRSLPCKGDRTFRLRSYSDQRLHETIANNLNCLTQMLQYNVAHNLLFFRITSELVPFASHPICTLPWQTEYKTHFQKIGEYIKQNNIRISMHPDQFIVLNSPREDVVQRSIDELLYHTQVLDLMGLDHTAKIQLHVGGVYNNKQHSMNRFIDHYQLIPTSIKKRLVIENDDKSYTATDCLWIHSQINIPIVFDYFHHTIHNNTPPFKEVFSACTTTWSSNHGLPMVDYSSQKPQSTKGTHAEHLNKNDFTHFIQQSKPYDFDIMLEIKDKERSALQACNILTSDPRLVQTTT